MYSEAEGEYFQCGWCMPEDYIKVKRSTTIVYEFLIHSGMHLCFINFIPIVICIQICRRCAHLLSGHLDVHVSESTYPALQRKAQLAFLFASSLLASPYHPRIFRSYLDKEGGGAGSQTDTRSRRIHVIPTSLHHRRRRESYFYEKKENTAT